MNINNKFLDEWKKWLVVAHIYKVYKVSGSHKITYRYRNPSENNEFQTNEELQIIDDMVKDGLIAVIKRPDVAKIRNNKKWIWWDYELEVLKPKIIEKDYINGSIKFKFLDRYIFFKYVTQYTTESFTNSVENLGPDKSTIKSILENKFNILLHLEGSSFFKALDGYVNYIKSIPSFKKYILEIINIEQFKNSLLQDHKLFNDQKYLTTKYLSLDNSLLLSWIWISISTDITQNRSIDIFGFDVLNQEMSDVLKDKKGVSTEVIILPIFLKNSFLPYVEKIHNALIEHIDNDHITKSSLIKNEISFKNASINFHGNSLIINGSKELILLNSLFKSPPGYSVDIKKIPKKFFPQKKPLSIDKKYKSIQQAMYRLNKNVKVFLTQMMIYSLGMRIKS